MGILQSQEILQKKVFFTYIFCDYFLQVLLIDCILSKLKLWKLLHRIAWSANFFCTQNDSLLLFEISD